MIPLAIILAAATFILILCLALGKATDFTETTCKCKYPIVRQNIVGDEYCGYCGKDLES